MRAIGWAGLLGVLLQMFFAGGIVAVLGRGPFSFGQFLEPARRNLWHNVKCFLLFALLAGVVLGALVRRRLRRSRRSSSKTSLRTPPAARAATCWVVVLVGAAPLRGDLSALRLRARGPALLAHDRRLARVPLRPPRALRARGSRALGLLLFWLVAGGAAVVGALRRDLERCRPSRAPAIALLFAAPVRASSGCASAVRVAAWGSYVAFLEPRARPRPRRPSRRVQLTGRRRPPAPAVLGYFRPRRRSAARPRGCGPRRWRRRSGRRRRRRTRLPARPPRAPPPGAGRRRPPTPSRPCAA